MSKIVTVIFCVFVTFIIIVCHGIHLLTTYREKFTSRLSDRDAILTNTFFTTLYVLVLGPHINWHDLL